MGSQASDAYNEEAKTHLDSAQLVVTFNGKGNVINVTAMEGEVEYDPGERKTIKQHGALASENWCRWILVNGLWK